MPEDYSDLTDGQINTRLDELGDHDFDSPEGVEAADLINESLRRAVARRDSRVAGSPADEPINTDGRYCTGCGVGSGRSHLPRCPGNPKAKATPTLIVNALVATPGNQVPVTVNTDVAVPRTLADYNAIIQLVANAVGTDPQFVKVIGIIPLPDEPFVAHPPANGSRPKPQIATPPQGLYLPPGVTP